MHSTGADSRRGVSDGGSDSADGLEMHSDEDADICPRTYMHGGVTSNKHEVINGGKNRSPGKRKNGKGGVGGVADGS